MQAGQTLRDRRCRNAGRRDRRAEDLPLTILYEDADVVVHRQGRRAWSCIRRPATAAARVVNALLHHVDDLSGVGGELRPGIVHRLDRGTSGRHGGGEERRAHQELSRQFHDREVEKEYVALVWGVVHAGKRIDAPIGRDPNDRQKMSTRARRARSAVTRVTVRADFKGVSLLQVAIATGRTHQIRVHLSAIGHPIVGDPTYGGVHRRVPNDVRAVQRLERPFLHAGAPVFTHPDRRPPPRIRIAAAGRICRRCWMTIREKQSDSDGSRQQ